MLDLFLLNADTYYGINIMICWEIVLLKIRNGRLNPQNQNMKKNVFCKKYFLWA